MKNITNTAVTKVQDNSKVELTKEEFLKLVSSVDTLFNMHMTLIEFYQEESELKKHHRAYLHVRDAAEAQINDDLEVIPGILDAMSDILRNQTHGKCQDCKVTPLPKSETTEVKEDEDPCVIMKMDDLYAMQQDMINLTDAIDILAKYYIATKYQAPINKQHYDDTVHRAKSLADEVFTKWENSTIEEIK